MPSIAEINLKARKLIHDNRRLFPGIALNKYWHPLFGFDVVRFDDEVVKPLDGTSTHSAIAAKWGQEAADLILTLIQIWGSEL